MKVNFKGFKDSVVKDESGKEILSFEKSKAFHYPINSIILYY